MKKIHMMGIGGSGIAGVAKLAEKMGYSVTGCDLEDSTAYAKNIFKGHSPDHLKGIDLLIVSPAVLYQNKDNPELIEGQKKGIVATWQEFLGETLLKHKKVIAIAGTHGKSTTTAMVGKMLIDAGLDPIVILGANVTEWGGSSRYGKGEYAVIEADEFNNNFLHYKPYIEVINNIEFDHPDFFKNEEAVEESFSKFVDMLRSDGTLILNWNDVGIQKTLLKKADPSIIHLFQYTRNFDLKIFGHHNQSNALMVYRLGLALHIPEKNIIKSIESFTGIGRRMELIADKNGVKVYDDYAHHPTAIKTTLEGLRNEFPTAKILTIVEPHGYKRTKALLPEYKGVFGSVDKVIIGPIFAARDEVDNSITPELVAITSNHANIQAFDNSDGLIRNLKLETSNSNYEVIVVMGAGKSYLWAREISGLIKHTTLIKENIDLRNLTTFKIGGKAKYFAEVKNEKDILEVSKFAKEKSLKIFILGGGSDILMNDKGFDGIVVKFKGKKISYKNNNITAEGGTYWDELVEYSVKNKLQGIECMSGIPGTVGASPVQNIGAYGQEVKDTLIGLTAFNFETGKFTEFSNIECEFGYRESFFKKPENWQKYLITSVTFKLNRNNNPVVKYESLVNFLKEKNIINPSLTQIRSAVLSLRKEKLENPDEFGNAGSFFKNPIVDKEIPGVPSYPFENKFKLFAGWLIDKAGRKGETVGGAAVSIKNALFIINKSGNATSSDVIELAKMVAEDVYKKFGVKLETEVQPVGFNYDTSIHRNYEKNKIAILGYGLEGQDAEKYLLSKGANVTILDQKFDEKYLNDLNIFDVIVRSPGVYRYKPEIIAAEKTGVMITSPINLFFENCPARIIGVTGTKGKGTTSTLIYEILKKAGMDVSLVGNIGKPYLELLSVISNKSYVVMELSSFQLIDLTKSPHIAVVLNITSDHMDWHKDREEYVDAKKNIVRHQSVSDFAVINEEYETPKSFVKETKAKIVFFSKIKLDEKYKKDLLLRGEHNLENIAAAVSVARILKIDEEITFGTVKNFKGLEHRLELVDTINGVTFYNDSFATGPQPTIAAVKSFTEPETLILGGSDKGLNYQELGKIISKKENIKNIILIGTTAGKIKDAIEGKDLRFMVYDLGFSDMNEIVKKAFEVTPKGGVVILSPASASFDMFKNYKDRGNQFKKAVQSLQK